MSLAVIVGSGAGVEEEYAFVTSRAGKHTVIGANFGSTVTRPDILFSNHLEALCEEIDGKVAAHWGGRAYDLHTTPLPGEVAMLPKYPHVTAWRDAYRKMVGTGLCATIAAKMMGFDRAIMVGCPHGGQYTASRLNFRPAEAKRIAWGENKGEAGRQNTDNAFLNVVPELLGFATSMSGLTREHLGAPKF